MLSPFYPLVNSLLKYLGVSSYYWWGLGDHFPFYPSFPNWIEIIFNNNFSAKITWKVPFINNLILICYWLIWNQNWNWSNFSAANIAKKCSRIGRIWSSICDHIPAKNPTNVDYAHMHVPKVPNWHGICEHMDNRAKRCMGIMERVGAHFNTWAIHLAITRKRSNQFRKTIYHLKAENVFYKVA